jgi:cytidylate kinase
MSVVTIRGRLGSGASEIARQIADRLQANYVDRQIIAEVAARLRRREEEVEAKEMPVTGLLGRIAETLENNYGFGYALEGAYLPLGKIPLDDNRYLEALKSVVGELARSQPLVILGRGSQFILKDYPGALHVLVVAPLEMRVRRIMQERNLGHETAALEIDHSDKSLRNFVKRYFNAELENPLYYDLVLNTERLTFQVASSIVVDTLSSKDQTGNSLNA